MERKIVHVVGTGTIGEPLIGLLCDYENKLGIDEVLTGKRNNLIKDFLPQNTDIQEEFQNV